MQRVVIGPRRVRGGLPGLERSEDEARAAARNLERDHGFVVVERAVGAEPAAAEKAAAQRHRVVDRDIQEDAARHAEDGLAFTKRARKLRVVPIEEDVGGCGVSLREGG